MQTVISFQRFLQILGSRGVIDVERDRERVWRLYFAMHVTTDEVVVSAIESELLRPERERTDA